MITNEIDIKDENDAYKFLEDLIFYADYHNHLLSMKKSKVPGYEGIYYLNKAGQNNLNLLFFGVIEPSDSEKEKELKTKIVSKFLDIRSGLYSWNMIDWISIHHNHAEYMLSLLKTIRDYKEKDPLVLVHILNEEIIRERNNALGWRKIDVISAPILRNEKTSKKNIFYLLARITSFLQICDNESDNYGDYYDSKYEIEHILAKDFSVNIDQFESEDQLNGVRDKIGSLGILSKNTNSSLKDESYSMKRDKYIKYNRFLGILSKDVYKDNGSFKNHPGLNKLISNFPQLQGLLKPYEIFDNKAAEERGLLMSEIAKIIWNNNDLLKIVKEEYGVDDFGEIKELFDEYPKYNDFEEEENHFYSGSILYFEIDNSYIEFVYNGPGRVTITKIVNGKLLKDSDKRYAENRNTKHVFELLIKELVLNHDGSYNWEGNIPNVFLKTPIYILIGSLNSGKYSAKKDYKIKEI